MMDYYRQNPDAPISHDWTGGGRRVKRKPVHMAGALVWVEHIDRDLPSFDYSGPALLVAEHYEACLCQTPHPWQSIFPNSSLRLIASEEEIKQRNKERK